MSDEGSPATRGASLGLTSLPPGTFEHDVAVSGKYQNFSTELLRLSLAGIGAAGFFIVNVMLTDKPSDRAEVLAGDGSFNGLLLLSLVSFGASAASALLHLYFGTDSKAYHLKYLRLENSLGGKAKIDAIPKREKFRAAWGLYWEGEEYRDDDPEKTIKKAAYERDVRNFLLRVSGKLLFFSGSCLWLGAVLLGAAFVIVLFITPPARQSPSVNKQIGQQETPRREETPQK